MSKTITIRPGPVLEENEIAIWEHDDAHPGGEIFLVQGGEPIEVAETEKVACRLADGRLARVSTDGG